MMTFPQRRQRLHLCPMRFLLWKVTVKKMLHAWKKLTKRPLQNSELFSITFPLFNLYCKIVICCVVDWCCSCVQSIVVKDLFK